MDALNSLLKFVTSQDQWDLLSQHLDGFNEQLLLGTPGVFLGPEASSIVTKPTLASLIGSEDNYPPIMPPIPMQNSPVPTSQFQGWRAGQFQFLNLLLVDEWGQALWPFNPNSYHKETIFLPPDLCPVLVSNVAQLAVTSTPAIAEVSPAAVAASSGRVSCGRCPALPRLLTSTSRPEKKSFSSSSARRPSPISITSFRASRAMHQRVRKTLPDRCSRPRTVSLTSLCSRWPAAISRSWTKNRSTPLPRPVTAEKAVYVVSKKSESGKDTQVIAKIVLHHE